MADQRTYKMLLGDIEAGGAGGGLFPIGVNNGTLDKTWREILNAIMDCKIPYVYGGDIEDNYASIQYVREVMDDDHLFYVHLVDRDDYVGYSTNSADGYPTLYD